MCNLPKPLSKAGWEMLSLLYLSCILQAGAHGELPCEAAFGHRGDLAHILMSESG